MADISQITLPSNQVLNIKDSTARQGLSTKVDIAQGSANANKYLVTDSNGNIIVQELPTASSIVLGAVKPVTKTADMTQVVGVDANGLLYTNASAQSDWNENDSTDPAYIQNRTHYVGETTNTQVWSDTISFDNTNHWEDDLDDYSWTSYLENGQAYSVVYNGTTYTGNVFYVSPAGFYAIGNLRLGDEVYNDTGEPFVISCAKNDSHITLLLSEEYTGDVSIALTLTITPIHKLDSKFLNGKLITEGTGLNSEIFNEASLNIASGNYSHAEGYQTSAEGSASHAEGITSYATGHYSHAEGNSTNAFGSNSHTEGLMTTATESDSHAEGSNTTASGVHSHTEGYFTTASGNSSHAEGNNTKATGSNSHAEGNYTYALGSYSHAEGHWASATGIGSHAEGGDFTLSDNALKVTLTGDANAITYTVSSNSTYPWRNLIDFYIGDREHQVINQTIENNIVTTITLNQTLSSSSISSKTYSVAKGNIASGTNAHTEGDMTVAHSSNTHAEGARTTALGQTSHSEGYNTIASGQGSHAEGYNTIASGTHSHTEGSTTKTTGANAHAEGGSTNAFGINSHAEGVSTTASGNYSHAEGNYATASGNNSHAEGYYTIANHNSQHVFGEYNVEDPSAAAATARGNYVEIVGKGTSTSARSNARTLDWSGNEVLAGKLTVGTGPTENMDVATKQYVDAATAGVSPNLSGLSDTNIANPANGQVLKYDSASSKWINGDDNNLFIINATVNYSSSEMDYIVTTDKNYTEIEAAYNAGKQCYIKQNNDLYYLTLKAPLVMRFTHLVPVSGVTNTLIYCISVFSDGSRTYYQKEIPSKIDRLTDVYISSSVSDGQVLTYKSSTSKWVAQDVATTISGLTDTTISSPATGQILTYDGTTSKWVNTTSPYMTASQVNELITAALAEYGDGDTASYGFEDASEVSY